MIITLHFPQGDRALSYPTAKFMIRAVGKDGTTIKLYEHPPKETQESLMAKGLLDDLEDDDSDGFTSERAGDSIRDLLRPKGFITTLNIPSDIAWSLNTPKYSGDIRE